MTNPLVVTCGVIAALVITSSVLRSFIADGSPTEGSPCEYGMQGAYWLEVDDIGGVVSICCALPLSSTYEYDMCR
ncbi:MAG: hypothetical protein WC455_10590 [Dehalococcoidia bacterium]